MYAPKIIKAFTLVELLVVMVIFGMMMVLSGGMTRRTRDTFVSQQFIKTAIQNARILRRKSMLITRNSGEKQWVQGIGFRIEKDATLKQWKMIQVKALSTEVVNNYFYQSFPTNDPCIDLSWVPATPCNNGLSLTRILNTTDQLLPEGMELSIINTKKLGPPSAPCTVALTIIYESINGKMHAYCQYASGINQTLGTDLNIGIRIIYFSSGSYNLKLNFKDNGEINAIK